MLSGCPQYSFSGEWVQPLEETPVGALDMGGASTQITFVPDGPILDKSAQATFRLYGSEHSVYTHSYLCFGRDQMLTRLLARLVQVGLPTEEEGVQWHGSARGLGLAQDRLPVLLQSSLTPLVRHPCYHSGYWATLSPAALYESPCVRATPPPDPAQNLTVEGTGNPGACISAIRGLFNFSSCQGRGHCAFDGVYQPPVRGRFYVSSLHCPPQGPSLLPEPQGPDAGWAQDEPWIGGVPVCGAGGTLPGLCWGCSGPGPRGHGPSAGMAVRLPHAQAFSNFYYTFHFLNLTSKQPLAAVNATVWEFCQRPWKQVGGSWGQLSPPGPPQLSGLQLSQAQTSASRDLVGPRPGQCGHQGLADAKGREDRPLATLLQAGDPGSHPRVGPASGGLGEGASPGSSPPGPPGGGELARAGPLAARLLCLGPVHTHVAA